MLLFNMDPKALAQVLAYYCQNEAQNQLSHSELLNACFFHGRMETDLIRLAGVIAEDICKVRPNWSAISGAISDTTKTSCLILLLGAGSLAFYNACFWRQLGPDLEKSGPDARRKRTRIKNWFKKILARSGIAGGAESEMYDCQIVQGQYFGPLVKVENLFLSDSGADHSLLSEVSLSSRAVHQLHGSYEALGASRSKDLFETVLESARGEALECQSKSNGKIVLRRRTMKKFEEMCPSSDHSSGNVTPRLPNPCINCVKGTCRLKKHIVYRRKLYKLMTQNSSSKSKSENFHCQSEVCQNLNQSNRPSVLEKISRTNFANGDTTDEVKESSDDSPRLVLSGRNDGDDYAERRGFERLMFNDYFERDESVDSLCSLYSLQDGMQDFVQNAREVRRLIREGSFDSTCTDLSLDFEGLGSQTPNIEMAIPRRRMTSSFSESSFLHPKCPDSPLDISLLLKSKPVKRYSNIAWCDSPLNQSRNSLNRCDSDASMEWESPIHGWHHVRDYPTLSRIETPHNTTPLDLSANCTDVEDSWQWDSEGIDLLQGGDQDACESFYGTLSGAADGLALKEFEFDSLSLASSQRSSTNRESCSCICNCSTATVASSGPDSAIASGTASVMSGNLSVSGSCADVAECPSGKKCDVQCPRCPCRSVPTNVLDCSFDESCGSMTNSCCCHHDRRSFSCNSSDESGFQEMEKCYVMKKSFSGDINYLKRFSSHPWLSPVHEIQENKSSHYSSNKDKTVTNEEYKVNKDGSSQTISLKDETLIITDIV